MRIELDYTAKWETTNLVALPQLVGRPVEGGTATVRLADPVSVVVKGSSVRMRAAVAGSTGASASGAFQTSGEASSSTAPGIAEAITASRRREGAPGSASSVRRRTGVPR